MLMPMENSPKNIRRQVYLLSEQDLTEHPLWEFCSDEEGAEDQDEATLRPAEERELQEHAPGVYVMAADIMFADGSKQAGYVYSGDPLDFGCTQPHVVMGKTQIGFWLGSLQFSARVEETLPQAYRLLGKSAESLFPLTIRSKVKVNGVFTTSIVEGFMARNDAGTIKLFR